MNKVAQSPVAYVSMKSSASFDMSNAAESIKSYFMGRLVLNKNKYIILMSTNPLFRVSF